MMKFIRLLPVLLLLCATAAFAKGAHPAKVTLSDYFAANDCTLTIGPEYVWVFNTTSAASKGINEYAITAFGSYRVNNQVALTGSSSYGLASKQTKSTLGLKLVFGHK